MNWITQRDEIGYQHYFQISAKHFAKVQKSTAGDYFAAIYEHEPECDPIDSNELYYFETLKKAKQFVESIIVMDKQFLQYK